MAEVAQAFFGGYLVDGRCDGLFELVDVARHRFAEHGFQFG